MIFTNKTVTYINLKPICFIFVCELIRIYCGFFEVQKPSQPKLVLRISECGMRNAESIGHRGGRERKELTTESHG